MYNKFLDAKELNVKIGDKVLVQGNKGIVTDVIQDADTTDVRVHFTNELAMYGQYQDKIYGIFKVVSE